MGRWRARLGGLGVCGGLLAGTLSGFAQEQIGTYEQLTVGATAVALATATTNPTGRQQMNRCSVQAEQMVRWRADGTNPTTAVGTLLTRTDDPAVLATNAVARRFRVISTSASNAIVNVVCEP